MEPEDELGKLIQEIKQDPEVLDVKVEKEKTFIAVDFGKLEETVILHYLYRNNKLVIVSAEFDGGIHEIDIAYADRILIEKEDLYKLSVAEPIEPKKYRSFRDQQGDYKFNYQHNHHPRSPRKRR